MRPQTLSRRRAIRLGVLGLFATAVGIGWGLSRPRARAASGEAPVIAIAWRAVGHDMEPWSGVGLAEQVRQALSARGIILAGRGASSSAASPDAPWALASLGRELNASYVLGGTVGHKDSRSEVGMQLVRVRDSAPVWASTFWRDPDDLDSLASDLAAAVAHVLETEAASAGRAAP